LKQKKKGGAFFVKSELSSLMILKSLSRSESRALTALTEAYGKHMIANPKSFLAKLFGMFRSSSGLYFVVMENVLPLKPLAVYDMKGSTIHRRAKAGFFAFSFVCVLVQMYLQKEAELCLIRIGLMTDALFCLILIRANLF
jgi:hypothetical protein